MVDFILINYPLFPYQCHAGWCKRGLQSCFLHTLQPALLHQVCQPVLHGPRAAEKGRKGKGEEREKRGRREEKRGEGEEKERGERRREQRKGEESCRPTNHLELAQPCRAGAGSGLAAKHCQAAM